MRLVGLGILLCTTAAAAGPLDKPAFTATPDELIALAAHAATTDAAIVVLEDAFSIDFDATGRATRRYRVVFVVEKQSGADGWGSLQFEWSPFYQDKPTVRARVVAARDQIAELDQKLVSDAPTVSESTSVFSDRRTLAVPLPRLVVGAVVEEQYTIVDRELLPAGMAGHELVGRGVPVGRTLMTVSAPSALKLHVSSRGFAKAPAMQPTTRAGRATWRFDLGASGPTKRRPAGTPSEISWTPEIGFASAPSWESVATAYRKIVDKRIADGPIALPSELKNAGVAAIVAWLHAHVRYTGIEVADAEIVPWTPAEVVARGFGDCKDKATLLVALLRAAGFTADVALLDTGPGVDVDPSLPGLGEFDHAIVRANVSGKDVWIDATESDLPAGQLPTRDQDRRVLVSGAKDLSRTPASIGADNAVHEIRTFHATEDGAASVTDVTTSSGTFVDAYRSWYRERPADEVRKWLEKRAKDTYGGTLDRYSGTSATDLGVPFAFTLEVKEARRVFTGRDQIDAYIYPSAALIDLPSAVDGDPPAEPRTQDFVWSPPRTFEIENRIVVPSGYSLPHLPSHEQQAVGTMTLTTDRRIDNAMLVVAYRLDSGKPRITAAELETTRKAVADLRDRSAEHIVIMQTGAQLMADGKAREAVVEYQRLIALHPKEALHYDQLADAYRQLGLGEAARRTARQGVAVEPTSADAHHMLAWELVHDTLGRKFSADWDRKGSIAEYRKSLAIDPKHRGALLQLATVLSRDARGRVADDPAGPAEAVTLLRRAKELDKTADHDRSIAVDLMLAGQLAEAEAAIRALPHSVDQTALLVAAVAAQRGDQAGIEVAGSVDRATVLNNSVGNLMLLRRYDLARAMIAASSQPDPHWSTVASRLATFDLGKLDPADPRTPAIRAMVYLLDQDVPPAAVTSTVMRDLMAEMTTLRDMITPWKMMPRRIAEDIIASLAKPSVEGSAATGWHVVLDVGGAKLPFYVTFANKRATLVGASDTPAELGRLVLGLLAKHDTAAAARWLGWFATDAHVKRPFAAAAQLYRTEAAMAGGAPASSMELVAALLVAEADPKLALPALQRCAITGDVAKHECLVAGAFALQALERWPEAVAAARAIPESDASWTVGQTLAAIAMSSGGDKPGAAAFIDGALAKRPDDDVLLFVRQRLAVRDGSWDLARAWVDKLAAQPNATTIDLNEAAWVHLFFDATTDVARELGERAESLANKKLSSALANTLAAIEAESGHATKAWAYLAKSIEGEVDDAPTSSDWYVLGRIAENVGLRDDAIAAYHRVKPDKHPSNEPTAKKLADRGLARLGAR